MKTYNHFTQFSQSYFVSIILLIVFTNISLAQRTDALVTFANNGAPENVILTWKEDPATTQAVTWRTSDSVQTGFAEIALADAAPNFWESSEQYEAVTESLETENGLKFYHSVNFTGLKPNTLYAYRVGTDKHWSEWFQFRTASEGHEPFSFIYFGDAQNNILSLWSRAIRSAYSEAPKAKFMVHAGDLINHANSDTEWREWFDAGDWIHAMVPSIPTPGNHEYTKNEDGDRVINYHWRPQFTLPENGIEGLEESVYYIDYQDLRMISLNSNERKEEQAVWLEKVLSNNTKKWTAVTYHHPLYSAATGRDNEEQRGLWKPLFDKYKVDIALQGHDHAYARGRNLSSGINVKDQGGTMYVVSVSGPKMYKVNEVRWMDRAAENTQLFQIISIDNDTLHYKAITATGKIYDAFDLVKQEEGPNKLIELLSPDTPERTFDSRD